MAQNYLYEFIARNSNYAATSSEWPLIIYEKIIKVTTTAENDG